MTDRNSLMKTIFDYQAQIKNQQQVKSQMIDFVKNNADCCLRSNLLGHITGSCWLVDPLGKDVLLTHHKKIKTWIQLGGHADGDFDPLQVALKEAREESGIENIEPVTVDIFDLDIHKIPEHGGIAEHLHYDIRFALRAPDRRFEVSEESLDLAWLPIVELAKNQNASQSLSRMAHRWLREFAVF